MRKDDSMVDCSIKLGFHLHVLAFRDSFYSTIKFRIRRVSVQLSGTVRHVPDAEKCCSVAVMHH